MKAKEFVTYPRPAEITALPATEVLAFLIKLWDTQYESSRLDFDRLFGAGQLARMRAVVGVQDALRNWLGAHAGSPGYDVAGCFLMGFWRGAQSASAELADLLVSALQEFTLTAGARDSVICALGAAYDLVSQPTRARIEFSFKRFWQPSEAQEYQPMVEAALKYVLRAS